MSSREKERERERESGADNRPLRDESGYVRTSETQQPIRTRKPSPPKQTFFFFEKQRVVHRSIAKDCARVQKSERAEVDPSKEGENVSRSSSSLERGRLVAVEVSSNSPVVFRVRERVIVNTKKQI